MITTIRKLLGMEPAADYTRLVRQGAVILDVRSKREYAGGHIEGAVNIPVDVLKGRLAQLGDKSTPVITCCASGVRSASAKRILTENGYTEVYNGGSWASLQHKIR